MTWSDNSVGLTDKPDLTLWALFISGKFVDYILNDSGWHILSVNLVYFKFISAVPETNPKSKAFFFQQALGLTYRGQVQSLSSLRSRESVFSLWFPALLRREQKFFLPSILLWLSLLSVLLLSLCLVLHIPLWIIVHMCANVKVFMT